MSNALLTLSSFTRNVSNLPLDNSISTELVSANPLYVPVAVFGFACSSFFVAVVTSVVAFSVVSSVAVDTGFSSSVAVSVFFSVAFSVVFSVAASVVVYYADVDQLSYPHAVYQGNFPCVGH